MSFCVRFSFDSFLRKEYYMCTSKSCLSKAAEQEEKMANNFNGRSNGEIEFRIVEHLGVIETQKNGWNREVNIVAWNGGIEKYDIREWDPEHERMSKGITLFEKEAERLAMILGKRFGIASAGQAEEAKMPDMMVDAGTEADEAYEPF